MKYLSKTPLYLLLLVLNAYSEPIITPTDNHYRDSVELSDKKIVESKRLFIGVYIREYCKDGICLKLSEIKSRHLREWISDDQTMLNLLNVSTDQYMRIELIEKIVTLYNARLESRLLHKGSDTVQNHSIMDICAFSDSLGIIDAEARSLKVSTTSIYLLSSVLGPFFFLFGGTALMLPPTPPDVNRSDAINECYKYAYSKRIEIRKKKYGYIALLSGLATFAIIGAISSQ
jgi:hypothetical protein